jgi:pyruvate formate lyase activating enzyme
MVSNGYVEEGPLEEYIGVTDAWNIDLKGWSKDFYRSRCGGERDAVLRTISRIAASDNHLEVTFLVIPGENDIEAEWAEMASWLSCNAGRSVPLHISRYYPRFRMENPPTPAGTIERAVEVFSEKLDFVYPGNMGGECDTLCPSCGAVLIERDGYNVKVVGIKAGQCSQCGLGAGVVLG